MLFGIISLQCPDPKFISALQAGSINIGSEDSILKRATANSNGNFIASTSRRIEINNSFYKLPPPSVFEGLVRKLAKKNALCRKS